MESRLSNLEFNPKQYEVLTSKARSILYGGAKGGGKSFLLRMAAMLFAMYVPGIQIYLGRRKYAELRRGHLFGPEGFETVLRPYINAGAVTINYSDMRINFLNTGAQIHLIHLNNETDIENYQGIEAHMLLLDEASLFPTAALKKFIGNLRLGDWTPDYTEIRKSLPFVYDGYFPKQVYASNPGGISHNFLKSRYIDVRPPMEIGKASAEHGGMLSQYIPALCTDNVHLMRNDPGYMDRIRAMGKYLPLVA